MTILMTTKKVEALRKVLGRYRDQLVKGLLLVVNGPNSASWQLRYEVGGRERWLGLGSARDINLAQARERAREKRLLLLDGIDPLDAKREAKAKAKAANLRSMTFQKAAELYLAQHSGKWRNMRELPQWTASLDKYVYPLIGSLTVDQIDTPHVLAVLEQQVQGDNRHPAGRLWGSRRETASRVRGRIESILGWSIVRGHRGEPNPARWQRHLSEALPGSTGVPESHFAAMPWADLPAFVAALRETTGVAGQALRFLIMTAARSGEVLGARWSEVDLSEGV
jgi:hypothetical protein